MAEDGEEPGGIRGVIARRTKNWSLSRDESFMRFQKPVWDVLLDYYFRMEVTGWDRLPESPALLVGIHASGLLPIEAYAVSFAWYRHFGSERPLHATTHDVLFALPLLGDYMRKMGAVPAAPDSISAALDLGHDVALWPGGDRDALRPWSQRDTVVLGGRRGFVKQAILSGVPIVPVPTIGGSDTLIMLTEGRGLAKTLRLDKLARTDVLPLALGFPFGVAPGVIPQIPLPAKLRSEFLDPIHLDTDPERAQDDAYVSTMYELVEERLQEGVTALASRRRFPLFG